MDLGLALTIGIGAGFLSGVMGIGGGMVLVPALVFLVGVEQHLAQGVSLAVVTVTSAIGAVVHYRHGNVDTYTAVSVAPIAVVFGVAGAMLAGRLDGVTLSRVFGIVVLGMSCWMLLGSAGFLQRSPEPGDSTAA